MKAVDAAKSAEAREQAHLKTLKRARLAHGRRVPPPPARDDRGERPAWRPNNR